jgi:gamma-glutamyltranspeptidase/glutathione hydrolase
MNRSFRRVLCTSLTAALALGACGGSDDDDDDSASATECQVLASDGSSVTVGSGNPGDPAAPELATGYRTGKTTIYARQFMVTTATPLASKAGCEVLAKGGSAVDASVAVQAVLGLVEPQSSGLGGGAFMLHYDAATGQVQTYDGRETAPAAATENYLRYVDDANDLSAPLPSARASGRSIGTPGAVRMLELAHAEHGSLAWKDLFGEATTLATEGFVIPRRMGDAIAGSADALKRDADAAAYFFYADGTPRAAGERLSNPAYGQTLSAIAAGGADAFYSGPLAQAIVDKIGQTEGADGSVLTAGKTTLADLAAYRAVEREAVCIDYRRYRVCGMPPPSSGGLAVAQTLGILENFNLALYPIETPDVEGGRPAVMGVHLVSEAERLAYADRDVYVADTDFVALPGGSPAAMLDKTYLRGRADLISFSRSIGTAAPGSFATSTPLGVDNTEERGTSHVSIVDKQGNVVSMTTTVESGMGSYHFTQGFILNNQLTDFSASPTDLSSRPIANRVAAGKRPRSSMSPTLVFERNSDGTTGDFLLATGSPGGSTIIQYVAKTLVATLDWGLDVQQATNLMHFGASNNPTTSLGGEHPNLDITDGGANDSLITGLQALGHTVATTSQSSGIGMIMRTAVGDRPAWAGSADPRREGLVLGDTFVP